MKQVFNYLGTLYDKSKEIVSGKMIVIYSEHAELGVTFTAIDLDTLKSYVYVCECQFSDTHWGELSEWLTSGEKMVLVDIY